MLRFVCGFPVLCCIIAVLYLYFSKRKANRSNCFRKMVCTGIPKDPPMTEQEKHDILRQDFKPSLVESAKWDVIVIGSGISGLTAAKILAAAGKKVLVLEQHDRAGGCCHTFELDKYEFDVGLHYVQDMYPGKLLYRICSAITDSQVQWQKMEEPFDVTIINDKRYGRLTGGRKMFEKQLKEWFPNEADNIGAFFKYQEACLKELAWMFRAKFMPRWLFRLLMKTGIFNSFSNVFQYTSRTVLDVMSEFGLSPDAQVAYSYYFVNYGIPPNRASFLQHSMFLMDSGYYPIGGATNITANIVRSIENFGGKVLVNAYVKQILFKAGKVSGLLVDHGRMGYTVYAPLIISTAPIARVINDLIPQDVAKRSVFFNAVNKLQKAERVRLAGFQAYIGLIGSQEELKLPSNNYFWFKSNSVLEIDQYSQLSLDDAITYGCPPFLYICFPSAKDPKWDERHSGKSAGISTCQVISFVNPEWFEQYKDRSKTKSQKRLNKDEYIDLKNDIGETVITELLKVFPHLKDKIAFTEFSSPLSQQFFLQNVYGELYSLTQQIERFQPEYWSELRCRSDLPGLYFSGQDVLFCGVSSAFHSGMLTAGTILGIDVYRCLNRAYDEQSASGTAKKID